MSPQSAPLAQTVGRAQRIGLVPHWLAEDVTSRYALPLSELQFPHLEDGEINT